jgi:hypothetical protein
LCSLVDYNSMVENYTKRKVTPLADILPQTWRWRYYISPKRQQTSAGEHGVTFKMLWHSARLWELQFSHLEGSGRASQACSCTFDHNDDKCSNSA